MNLRRSERKRSSTGASGSEYHASEKSVDMHDVGAPEEDEGETAAPVEYTHSRHGRRLVKKTYMESSDGGDGEDAVAADQLFDTANEHRVKPAKKRRQVSADAADDEDEGMLPRHHTRSRDRNLADFVVSDEDDKLHEGRYGLRTRSKPQKPVPNANGASQSNGIRRSQRGQPPHQPQVPSQSQRPRRLTRRSAREAEEDFYPDHTSSGASADADADGSFDDALQISDLEPPEPEPEPEPEIEEETDGKPYALRQRQKINYAIPPPLEEMRAPAKPARTGGRNGGGHGGGGHGAGARGKGRTLGWSATGKELGKWMGMGGDDSDSDYPTRTPRKHFGGIAPFGTGGTGAVAGGGMLGGDLAAGGTPSNLGKVGEAALADADPLGVNQNVTFDEIGGLDGHIHSLKEMTLLPLLYPEVFQRFNVTPPRGVLFHGPPGTGKTLLARALAASCRSGGRQISFFMRKGADCLSKWVGEAERQLRLLFEEARASQPSIIFFDEIDGLAPVRSSKQDQIHASIVSTLLALMDGMDGRGQVVVIGATNRPDAVDPALRRPGRFDREFYFGLPDLDAREKILSIMTRGWEGWGKKPPAKDVDMDDELTLEAKEREEQRTQENKERVRGLAKLTKGYGGADLRALCTEAALNAIQRRYPQVYKSTDRLLLKPETIGVGLRDFMISIKKLVPSSARSSSSAATPLPTQFVPLLSDTLDRVKDVIQRVLPVEKKLSALEEAEFEDDGGEEGALEREMLSQAMQTLRVYRPRVIVHGSIGMGQGYVGAAALHHLEGYHVQSLELGTLMSDSARTTEAAIVQLFVEAKRNQPSVIYIPSLVGWCAAVTETTRSTVRAMLDTLAPTDPILLLAVVDGPFSELPKDVKAWFGPSKHNRIQLTPPSVAQREAFFEGLIKDVQRPPNQFADGVARRKRVLEELPIAPPIEPRKPTPAELALQEENDQRTITLLKYRLGPILTELKRKFKRFTKRATEEYDFDPNEISLDGLDTVTTTVIEVHEAPNGIIDMTGEQPVPPLENGAVPMNEVVMEQQQIMQQRPPLYDMDLERMHAELFKGRYLTPQDFLDDVGKMVHNADVRAHEDSDRLHKAQAMFTAAQLSILEFDPQLRQECERMAVRERQRRDQHRKGKGKDKANGESQPNGSGAVPARRSARNNGQQPDYCLTDPVKLERRLKRQRGDEVSGDSHTSEEEAAAHGQDGERDAKRSRIIEEDDGRDPLDTIGQTPSSEVRSHHVVRFAAERVEPMAPLTGTPEPLLNGHQYGLQVRPQPQHYQNPLGYADMVVDESPRRQGGFDPSLLNPMQPADNPFVPQPFREKINPSPFNFMSMDHDSLDPFAHQPVPQFSTNFAQSHHAFAPPPEQPLSFMQMLAKTPTPPPPVPLPQIQIHPQPQAGPSTSSLRVPTPSRTPEPPRMPTPTPAAPSPPPVPMVVERSPTPPLPDFVLDDALVQQLRKSLKDSTTNLTIEQLEQLRATSLGTVWRHRKEWDRDDLVRELLDVVKEFVEEITEDWDTE